METNNGNGESVFGLAPMTSTPGSRSLLVRSAGGRTLTRDETRIADEWHKQTLVMEGTAAKAMFGVNQIADMHEHGSGVFDAAASHILSVQKGARGTERQAYVDEFTTRQLQSMGRVMIGAMEVAATNIGYEINRSLYPPPEPRGMLQKIFGGE